MKTNKPLDYLIVGGGLIGLSLLKKVLSHGHKALLIEKSGQLGGSLLKDGAENFSLDSLTWTDEVFEGFNYDQTYAEALTLGKKGLIPFMGFGEEKVEALDLIQSFVGDHPHIASSIKHDFWDPNLMTHISLHSEITAFHKNDDDQSYTHFEINGKNSVQAQNVLWTAPIQGLEPILPKEGFSQLRAKIKKEKALDAITVQFDLPQEELGGHKNKRFVFLGEEGHVWMGARLGEDRLVFVSYYSRNLSGDHDFIRKHLKQLKKQMHKAFPEVFDENFVKGHKGERFVLHNSAVSNINPVKPSLRLKDLDNLFLFSSQKHFGFHPLDGKLKALQEESFIPQP